MSEDEVWAFVCVFAVCVALFLLATWNHED
jgi:hypothetical protein